MNIFLRYEAGKRLNLPCRKILEDVIAETLHTEHFPCEAEVSVTMTDNDGIRKLNRKFRKLNRETDVLSFPMIPFRKASDFRPGIIRDSVDPETGECMIGDIVLNVDRIRSQAHEYGHSQKRELAFLTVHSMLHLLGYDHVLEKDRVRMEKKQKIILDACGYFR